MTNKTQLNYFVADLLDDKGINPNQLSRILSEGEPEHSKAKFYRWENGVVRFSLSLLLKIQTAFEMSDVEVMNRIRKGMREKL